MIDHGKNAECYNIDEDGYVYGPYNSEKEASISAFHRNHIMWLTNDEIDQDGFVRNWNER